MKVRRIVENTYTWNQVKEILAAGKAREEFGLGGEFTVMVEDTGEVVIQILDFDKERVVIPNKNHNMTVMFRDLVLEERPFDEDSKNVWRTSSLRAELNSPDFVNRFEEGFRELIVPVLKDNTDGVDTEDVFFLVSKDELKDEKKRYAFFRTGRDCVKVNKDGETEWHWTRSAYYNSLCHAWSVGASGYTFFGAASHVYRFSPLVVLSA